MDQYFRLDASKIQRILKFSLDHLVQRKLLELVPYE